jgi:hypothetical protein
MLAKRFDQSDSTIPAPLSKDISRYVDTIWIPAGQACLCQARDKGVGHTNTISALVKSLVRTCQPKNYQCQTSFFSSQPAMQPGAVLLRSR